MSQPVDIIRSHMVNHQPVPQLHRAVNHKFILCDPYNEKLSTYKNGTIDFNVRKPIITADSKKNEFIIALLKEFVADGKAIMIFAEQKSDIENLSKFFIKQGDYLIDFCQPLISSLVQIHVDCVIVCCGDDWQYY